MHSRSHGMHVREVQNWLALGDARQLRELLLYRFVYFSMLVVRPQHKLPICKPLVTSDDLIVVEVDLSEEVVCGGACVWTLPGFLHDRLLQLVLLQHIQMLENLVH